MGSIIATIALGFAAIVGGMVARELPKAKPLAPTVPVAQTENAPAAATTSIALPDSAYKRSTAIVAGKPFGVLVADTDNLRELGLSGRKGLEDGRAMLFIFDKPDFLGFWMKDMLFPIDMLWLDESSRIVSWRTNVSPATYPEVFYPASLSKYVIEFPAGTLDSLGVSVGDRVEISRGK